MIFFFTQVQETAKRGIVGDRTITVIKGQKGEPTTLRITKRKDKSWTPKTVFPTIVIFYYD